MRVERPSKEQSCHNHKMISSFLNKILKFRQEVLYTHVIFEAEEQGAGSQK